VVSVTILELSNFDAAFGEIGAKVGPRTGPNKRSQEEKEWYVIRRFLGPAIARGIFRLPLVINKSFPPEPDFVVRHDRGHALIEITEATSPEDQKEMTLQEQTDEPILLGELGGRFAGGGSEPEHLWVSDIVDAIKRKATKSIFSSLGAGRHLVIYPNSNASSLIFDHENERRAFSLLASAIDSKRTALSQVANGCAVHILAKDYVFFDVLGKSTRRRRK
jgi:hypothetical protein